MIKVAYTVSINKSKHGPHTYANTSSYIVPCVDACLKMGNKPQVSVYRTQYEFK